MIKFILPLFLLTSEANADAICNDGTRSHSYGQGMCSHTGTREYHSPK
jgi:hypothetical protein